MNTSATVSNGESFRVVIPARYAASRLPGKPLRMLGSKPLLGHVYENALRSGAELVLVATDEIKIAQYIESIGGVAQMTSTSCASGSDRIAEAIDELQWPDNKIIVNVQSDEPFLPPQNIKSVATALAKHSRASAATLSAPLRKEHLEDVNVVKVIADTDGMALQFSRTPVKSTGVWRHHIGIYAYRCSYLRRFTKLEVPETERNERLEQLRALHHGDLIYIHETKAMLAPGVDTKKDLIGAIKLLNEKTAKNEKV